MNSVDTKYNIVFFTDEEEAFKSIYSFACFYMRKRKMNKAEFNKFMNEIWFEQHIEEIKPITDKQNLFECEECKKAHEEKEKKART